MKQLFYALFLFFMPLLPALTLKERLIEGEIGSYVVTEQRELASLLHLHSKGEGHLLLEEVSIPLSQAKGVAWKEWLEGGAPGHTAWTLYEVDLKEVRITRCYSFTQKGWMRTEELTAFFIPFISLELHPFSEEEQLARGPSKRAGEVDRRPWAPPQIVAGVKQPLPDYEVYTTTWIADQSELSKQPLLLYLDKRESHFPFPYWVQTGDGAIKFKVRAIDSGRGLRSPHKGLPEGGKK